jgi:hypothetical protein
MRKVDSAELAEILGVNKSTVSKAIERKRLSKSILKSSSGRYEIDLIQAILEWFHNADYAKDRGGHLDVGVDTETLLEHQESKRLYSHYAALKEKIDYLKITEALIPREQVEKEVFEAARMTREKLQNLADTLCHGMAIENDPLIIRRILKDSHDQALEELTRGG